MRQAIRLAILSVVALLAPVTTSADLFQMLGIGSRGGQGCNGDCGDACGCEAGCSCDPTCECDAVDGRAFAGKTWTCCSECGPPICRCTGPCHCSQPSCGCASTCGCERRSCPQSDCCFGNSCGRLVGLVDRFCGCTGCDGELYWSEWHNDPPRCCDPCDCHGNWIGPRDGSYRAPYDHPYYVGSNAREPSRNAISTQPVTRGMTRKPDFGRNSTYRR